MPNFNIIRESNPRNTFRVSSVVGRFDLQSSSIKEKFIGNIDIDNDWQIGLIVGNSGTGKSTIAKEIFEEKYFNLFDYNADSILDDMPKNKTIDEIIMTFNSVGFSSPPSWLKPYSVLSNGEKMRVDLARCILSENEYFVFDEFTSVVDREVAKITSYAIQKSIRKSNKKFIAISCHYDIQEWLMPDWVFNTNSMTFINKLEKKNQTYSLKYTVMEIKKFGKCLVNTII